MKIFKPIIMVLAIISIAICVCVGIWGTIVLLTYTPPSGEDKLGVFFALVIVSGYVVLSVLGIITSITMMLSTHNYSKNLCRDISKTYHTLKIVNLVISILSFVSFWLFVYLEIYVRGYLNISPYRKFQDCTAFICIIGLIFNIVFLIVSKIVELVKKHKRYKRANDGNI